MRSIKKNILFFILLSGAGAIYILPLLLKGDFIVDDFFFIINIQKSKNLYDFLTHSGFPFLRPVIEIFNYIRFKIFGLRPFFFYFTNFLIHIINSILLFIFMKIKGFKEKTCYFSVSLFFLLFSPYEAKLWIAGSSSLLLVSFILSSLILHHFFNKNRKNILLLLLLFMINLTLYTKEPGVVLIPIILLLDIFEKNIKKNLIKLHLPAIISLGIYLFFEITNYSKNKMFDIPYYPGLHIFPNILMYYTYLFFPSVYHSSDLRPIVEKFPSLFYSMVLFNLITLLSIVPFTYLVIKERNRILKWAFLSLFISFAPFLPFNWEVSTRYLYLPSIFFSMFTGYFFVKLVSTMKGRLKIMTQSLFHIFLLGNWAGLFLTSISMVKLCELQKKILNNFFKVHGELQDNHIIYFKNTPPHIHLSPPIIARSGKDIPVYSDNDRIEFGVKDVKELYNIKNKGKILYIYRIDGEKVSLLRADTIF